ncbi:MAG: hypothetical protein ACI9ND_003164, partial [Yoonia sp.]
SQPDTTDAQRYSYLLSPSQQPSCSGYKSMSLEPSRHSSQNQAA